MLRRLAHHQVHAHSAVMSCNMTFGVAQPLWMVLLPLSAGAPGKAAMASCVLLENVTTQQA